MMLALMLAAAQAANVASLRVSVPNGSEVMLHVREDRHSGYVLTIDCVSHCAKPLTFKAPIGDAPVGLVDLETDGLIYSVWGTGCCYMVRVWKVSANGVKNVLETGSRSQPSLSMRSGVAIETYMRPVDRRGRESGPTSLKTLRWTYRHGRFTRS